MWRHEIANDPATPFSSRPNTLTKGKTFLGQNRSGKKRDGATVSTARSRTRPTWILQAGCLLDPQVSNFQTTAYELLEDLYEYTWLPPSERQDLLGRLGFVDEDQTPEEVEELEAMPVDLGFKPPADFVREHRQLATELGLDLAPGDVPGEPFERAITKTSAADLTAGFKAAGWGISVIENLLTRDEHLVISSWLDLTKNALPAEARRVIQSSGWSDGDWAALRILGTRNEDSDKAIEAAVAATVLRAVWNRLPQWGAWSPETGGLLGRQKPQFTAQEKRKISLLPRRVLSINWANSGPGYSWPNEYNVTWLPIYNYYVLTVSADSPEGLGGYTDLAISAFRGDNLTESSVITQKRPYIIT